MIEKCGMNGVGWERGVMKISQDVSFGVRRVIQIDRGKKKIFWDVWEHTVIFITDVD